MPGRLAAAVLCLLLFGVMAPAVLRGAQAASAADLPITVTGNRHIDAAMIRSHVPAGRGRLDAAALDAALKSLYATGLFADVKITRQGDGILIRGDRESDRRSAGVRGQQEDQGRGSQKGRAIEAGRAAVTGDRARRRRSDRRALPAARLFPREGGSADHQTQEWTRDARFCHHGRRQACRPPSPVCRQRGFFRGQAQRRHQNRREQCAQLFHRQRHLQCRPNRSRPRPHSPLLSEQRLRRRTRAQFGKLSGRQKGRRRHFQHRRRGTISPRARGHRVKREVGRCGFVAFLPAHVARQDL